MANRRPAIIAPGGALVFAPSEAADSAETYNSPVIRLATRYGSRFIKFSLDTSDNLTVTEVDQAGNTVGLGVIVSAVTVTVGTQKTFALGPTNLSLKYKDPSGASGQVGTGTGNDGGDVFIFENGNTGSNQGMGSSTTTTTTNPSRTFAGTSLEASVGAGGQVN